MGVYSKTIPVPQLVEQGVDKVPEDYIQTNPVHYNLSENLAVQNPVIDLSAQPETIVSEIAKACQEWGFFQVINHGIPQQVVENMLKASADFFNLPMADKEEFFSETPAPKITRYSFRFDNSSTPDWRDFLFIGSCLPLSDETIGGWPHKPPAYRDATAKFSENMKGLACKLLEFISESLGLSSTGIVQALGGDIADYSMLVNRYLPCPQPELVLALRAHSDPNVITLLVENKVPGLQVFKDGAWINVESLPNSIIVNLGDQIEIMSNGKYKSAEHRALANSTATRYSIASFIAPPRSETVLVGPLPELVGGSGDPPRFKALNYKEYLHLYLVAKQAQRKTTLEAVAR